jgi:acetoin utilization protein AcuB
MRKTVDESMTRDLVTVRWDENLERAYLKLKESRIRHLPVIDGEGNLVGIISDRDFQRAMRNDSRDFSSLRMIEADFDPQDRVADFMSWPVRGVSHDIQLQEVTTRMIDEKISAFVVLDGHRVTGIITSEDLLRVLADLLGDNRLGLKVKIRDFAYNSSIGKIADFLGNSGI